MAKLSAKAAPAAKMSEKVRRIAAIVVLCFAARRSEYNPSHGDEQVLFPLPQMRANIHSDLPAQDPLIPAYGNLP